MCSTFTTLLLFFLGLPSASTLPLELLLLIHLLLYALIVIVIDVQPATTYLDLTVESEQLMRDIRPSDKVLCHFI